MKLVLLAFSILPVMNPLFAQTKNNKDTKSSIEEILIQMEIEWSQADVKKDRAALDRILAEDWMGIDFTGTVMTKAEVMRDLRSDATATESTELREIKVRVFGNTALVSGTEVEKSQYKGQDSSGAYIWTDVFVLRNGRWQAVSSQSTKLADGPRLFARDAQNSERQESVRTRSER